MEEYWIGQQVGELTAICRDHSYRLERLEAIEKRVRHWLWRGTVLACIWAWPTIALLRGPDIANGIASILKAALTK